MTHTFAELEVSDKVFDEIELKLKAAGYDHAFVDGVIDMHGIGLIKKAKPPRPATTHFCPRRAESPQSASMVPEGDHWDMRDGHKACSYCGSMEPEEFLAKIEAGEEVVPTDKNYKAYIGKSHGKFYYMHFSEEQMIKFIELYNNKTMKIGMPGHFYVRPYFMKPVEA